MIIQNPIIRGFYPDPSICRVGDDFYIVNSTFEFFPGVPIFHSRDLVNWEQIGHCLSRSSQLRFEKKSQNNTGIFAPSIRYKDGIFYMITTNVTHEERQGSGNFYVWTKDPAGEWSDPIFLGTPGIDPSLFFDSDNKDYYVGTCDDGIYIQEIDLSKGKIVGSRIVLWGGTGGSYPEGPHLYKKDGWYYLLISEGGTERSHMITMARSKNVEGPYEECPSNPVLTNRSLGLAIESVGHADLAQDQRGNWWAVCLGTRTFDYPPKHNLGRETMLVPVDWSGEWPVFGINGRLEEQMEVKALPAEVKEVKRLDSKYEDDFSKETLDLSWNFIYAPEDKLWETGKGALRLWGNEYTLSDVESIAWLGRRQQHHKSATQITVKLSTDMDDEEAGITVYLNNNHHYEVALVFENGKHKLVLRRQIGSLRKVEKVVEWLQDNVTFEILTDKEWYTFCYISDNGEQIVIGKGETNYLTTEVGGHFTGNYIALYATGNGHKCEKAASFTNYRYIGKE